jgi:hypothetical protein
MTTWIGHCHLDASIWNETLARANAARQSVTLRDSCRARPNFEAVRLLAHSGGDSYALEFTRRCLRSTRWTPI